jgi:hypothetical protein
MKNLLIAYSLVLLALISCKDENTEPTDSIKIEDLLGTWVSVDSAIVQVQSGKFEYLKDTLLFKEVTSATGGNPIITLDKYGVESANYTVLYFKNTKLDLSYDGPNDVGIIDNNFKHELKMNTLKDSLKIDNFKKTYPGNYFNHFYKAN